MGTILTFTPPVRDPLDTPRRPVSSGQVLVFPGLRIDRPDVDLSQRLRDSVGLGDFDNFRSGGLTNGPS